MEILIEVGAFFGKALILTSCLIALIAVIAQSIFKNRPQAKQLLIEDLNERLQSYMDTLKELQLSPKEFKKELKTRQKKAKEAGITPTPRLFVLNFDGDIKASAVEQLRDEVTALLTHATPNDEVLVKVTSTGGMVHTYGLAASQLLRIRERHIPLTVAVDKVAASGGYLMACTANTIISAPFAILGSIGVVAQVPNFHKVLKKNDIDYEELTAGEFKRTVSMLSEITPKGKEKFILQLEETHQLFKAFVGQYRPQLDLNQIATGEHWYGQKALELKLCDKIQTSDDYIFSHFPERKILELSFEKKKSLGEKISEGFSITLEKVLARWIQSQHDSRFQ